MLTNYFHVILAVVLAQFRGLGFLDGMEGVIRLAEASPYFKVQSFLDVRILGVQTFLLKAQCKLEQMTISQLQSYL